ncbi:NADPH:quinone reductase-like Zn-dependent oxidoreductase [Mucilaginibacter gracilis]|uniref:NADPH:quinone reductase-like Zn-dependent oxidoreductase n=1 Tax=Mucilaginibacter gracilis TaxID=423350 RepID=A0A495IYZ2_9SPHI|nr:zinc-binding dehydrogenase [Mucilaginibacter gracilis]RKR81601.1 NADPH:quinone reductase-like Zn-dependent oxidoreductase [Mucilaginibacter gracilis]
MKAIVLESAENPIVYKEVEIPTLAPGEVLVQLKAAALNRRDYWITVGKYAGIKYPSILGSDGAGIVTAVGEGTDAAWIGKEVIINPSHDYGDSNDFQGKDFKILGLPEDGTFAEYVKTPAQYLHPKPAHLTWEQAAAIPLAGLTAYRALFTKGKLKAADKVLIVGAGSGTGSFAIQWAIAAGATVYVTSGSADKIELAKSLGAIDGVNYKDADWDKQLQQLAGGFDVVIDSALGEGFAKLPDICNPGARIVTFGGTAGDFPAFNARRFFYKQLQLLGSMMGTTDEFDAMLTLIDKHQIVPVVDEVFPLEQAAAAIAKMEKSNQFGKIVLKVG